MSKLQGSRHLIEGPEHFEEEDISPEEIEVWAEKRYPSSSRMSVASDKERDWVILKLEEKGLAPIDKRPQGGALWVAGRLELKPLMDELALAGAPFNYAIHGGKAIQYSPGWWMRGYPDNVISSWIDEEMPVHAHIRLPEVASRVRHALYGNGTVQEISVHKIRVKFDGDGRTKGGRIFNYPAVVLDGYLEVL